VKLYKFTCHDHPWNTEDVYIVAEDLCESRLIFEEHRGTYEIDAIEFIHDPVFLKEATDADKE